MMKAILFIFIMSYFVVFIIENNAYSQSDKVKERQYQERGGAAEALVNMTDKMKFLCIQIDASNTIDQLEDKEQREQCKKFLDKVSIFEMSELIDTHLGIELEKTID
jgi:hypothetical protein